MNNEQIKEMLIKLEDTDTDFTVTMTGKSSKKVNGFYKPGTHEIFLHNLNFKSDNALIYTAIHEYTHHLIESAKEKNGKKGSQNAKSHDSTFWAKMDDLLENAVNQGVYERKRSESLMSLIEDAKKIDQEIANLKKKLGKVLNAISVACDEEGTRFEDVLSHDIKMQKKTALNCVKAKEIEKDDIGQDLQEVLVKTVGKRREQEAAEKAIDEGKTVEQTKHEIHVQNIKSKVDESPYDKLVQEKNRLEKTISSLQERLSFVCESLESM